jgi:hypothetical protein
MGEIALGRPVFFFFFCLDASKLGKCVCCNTKSKGGFRYHLSGTPSSPALARKDRHFVMQRWNRYMYVSWFADMRQVYPAAAIIRNNKSLLL